MAEPEWSTEYYLLPSGISPFQEWRNAITDLRSKAAIDARVSRMRGGNFGDSGLIGDGASESRIDFGPGFRIYYGRDGEKIILLDGGDKSTQAADISDAKGFWNSHKERKKRANEEQKAKLQKRSSKRSKKR